MTDKIMNDIESFLDDDKISQKLVLMSLQISLFEIINYQVLNAPRNFFNKDIRLIESKLVTCDETVEYIENVKKHFKKDLYKSSAHWYKINDIISQEDFDLLIRLRDNRNHAAHEIINILFDSNFSFNEIDFRKAVGIYKKMCLWWIIEVESTINPIFDSIDRESFDYESAIEPQLFPAQRLMDLLNKILK